MFAFHGQPALCFTYDDRAGLDDSARQLNDALELLSRDRRGGVTVIGHSQGGLVARAALSTRTSPRSRSPNARIRRLVTISSPFAGIASAADCGRSWLHVVTLGITVGVCQAVAGSKWTDIHEAADFMRNPGDLRRGLGSHLVVITDEHGACLRRNADGSCATDDFVFSVGEQSASQVQASPRTITEQVTAGHVEIVGETGHEPWKLIDVLQRHGVLAPTPAKDRAAFSRFVRRVYARAPSSDVVTPYVSGGRAASGVGPRGL